MAETPITPEYFLAIAQGARANEARYDTLDTEAGTEQARMWGVIATALESAARAAATVPPATVVVVGAAAAVVQAVPERNIRAARRNPDGTVMARNAYVPYARVVALVEAIEHAFPDLFERIGMRVAP